MSQTGYQQLIDEEEQGANQGTMTGPELVSPHKVIRSQFVSSSAPITSYYENNNNELNNSPNSLDRKRSHSIISIDFKNFNETVLKWKNSLFSSNNNAFINEIEYSVFKPLTGLRDDGAREVEEYNDKVEEERFIGIVRESIEAIESGFKPKRISTGSSGSYFIYNRHGEIVAVFKPKDEEPYGPLSPKWTKWLHRNLFPCFFGRSCLIPNLGYICESAASLLDRRLKTNIVPFTDIVELKSDAFYYSYWDSPYAKVGSFQLFLKDYMEADKFLNKYPLPNSNGWRLPSIYNERIYSHSSSNSNSDDSEDVEKFEWNDEVLLQFRQELEKLVILDYIMRNTDRGLDNWMIKIEWIKSDITGKKSPVLKIGAIDSGLSWPWKHPDEWRSYPFGWLFLPASLIGQPFQEVTRNHFLRILTDKTWWEESLVVFRDLFAKDDDFNEKMFKKQWSVMKGQAFNVVETLKNPTFGPLDLARRVRVLVEDDEMEIPVTIPYNFMHNAIETPILNSIEEEAQEAEQTEEEINENTHLLASESANQFATKTVIIERVKPVLSQPPIFTWC